MSIISGLSAWISYTMLAPFIRSFLVASIGIPLLWAVTTSVKKLLQKHLTPHISIVISKILFYIGLILIMTDILTTLGFQLTALLGAAGIVGIAVGFAARTSVSNIISGIFLLLERSFAIGDVLEYESMIGVVQSINLFSVQLRTFHGKLIRIPNESILQQVIVNSSYFQRRRIAFQITVSKLDNYEQFQQVIFAVIKLHNNILADPKPELFMHSVHYFSTVCILWIWTEKEHAVRVSHDLMPQLVHALHEKNYTIAMQQYEERHNK